MSWYKDGLHFTCTECGKCCTGSGGRVWVSEDEAKDIASYLKISLKDFKRRYTRMREGRLCLAEKKSEGNPCIFLENKRCQIYPARPNQCRTYPWWPENLNTPESWQSCATVCEGINKDAALVQYSDIVKFTRSNNEDL